LQRNGFRHAWNTTRRKPSAMKNRNSHGVSTLPSPHLTVESEEARPEVRTGPLPVQKGGASERRAIEMPLCEMENPWRHAVSRPESTRTRTGIRTRRNAAVVDLTATG